MKGPIQIQVPILSQLEKETATYSSIPAWEMSQTEDRGAWQATVPEVQELDMT